MLLIWISGKLASGCNFLFFLSGWSEVGHFVIAHLPMVPEAAEKLAAVLAPPTAVAVAADSSSTPGGVDHAAGGGGAYDFAASVDSGGATGDAALPGWLRRIGCSDDAFAARLRETACSLPTFPLPRAPGPLPIDQTDNHGGIAAICGGEGAPLPPAAGTETTAAMNSAATSRSTPAAAAGQVLAANVTAPQPSAAKLPALGKLSPQPPLCDACCPFKSSAAIVDALAALLTVALDPATPNRSHITNSLPAAAAAGLTVDWSRPIHVALALLDFMDHACKLLDSRSGRTAQEELLSTLHDKALARDRVFPALVRMFVEAAGRVECPIEQRRLLAAADTLHCHLVLPVTAVGSSQASGKDFSSAIRNTIVYSPAAASDADSGRQSPDAGNCSYPHLRRRLQADTDLQAAAAAVLIAVSNRIALYEPTGADEVEGSGEEQRRTAAEAARRLLPLFVLAPR